MFVDKCVYFTEHLNHLKRSVKCVSVSEYLTCWLIVTLYKTKTSGYRIVKKGRR